MVIGECLNCWQHYDGEKYKRPTWKSDSIVQYNFSLYLFVVIINFRVKVHLGVISFPMYTTERNYN